VSATSGDSAASAASSAKACKRRARDAASWCTAPRSPGYREQAAEAEARADFASARSELRQALLVTPRPSAEAEAIERELAQLDIRAADHRPSEPLRDLGICAAIGKRPNGAPH
jgi:hypothetical protein